jgi:putative peptidoglycan lipid II flippase
VPYGVFAVAIGVVAMPNLVEAAAGRRDFDEELLRATRLQLALLLPVAIAIGSLATWIVTVVYQRGTFDAGSTRLTANALAGCSFTLPAMGLSMIGARAWLSRKRPWVPALVAIGGLVLNGLLDWLLVRPLGLFGIGLSTACVHLGVGLLLLLFAVTDRARYARALGGFGVRLGLTCVPAAAFAVGAQTLLGPSPFRSPVSLLAGIVGLLAGARLCRLQDYEVVLRSLRRRGKVQA